MFLYYAICFRWNDLKLHEQIVGSDWHDEDCKIFEWKTGEEEMQRVNEDLKAILQAAKQIGIVLFFFFFQPLKFKK